LSVNYSINESIAAHIPIFQYNTKLNVKILYFDLNIFNRFIQHLYRTTIWSQPSSTTLNCFLQASPQRQYALGAFKCSCL